MRLCELRMKEVINICDGKRLGFITDVEFDCRSGCIISFIIPGPAHICGFLGRDSEYIIPFHCVEQIGEDFVLVKVVTEECMHKCK
ncbi:MAG: YlmC/YmxH family sporulation protein [Lachnospiraceae bacterium]|nr:YlmC/YmxH family sporulation protein [Lachnospiraceae bacterium]